MKERRIGRIGHNLPSLSSSGQNNSSASPSSKSMRGPATVLIRGTVIAERYQIIGALGVGGMGSVYDAVDLADGKIVALKSLKKRMTEEHLQRFKREATAAMAIRHPHVRVVHAYGVARDVPFIVMELLEGETVRARIQRDGALSAADAISISIQLLDALVAAHAAHVLHRDVKPGNLFITSKAGEAPFVKLIDFGLARLLPSESEEPTQLTSFGVIPGTPAYLAPEQIAGDQKLDERVDVWGAALTIVEMLLGKQGFAGGSMKQLVSKILLSPAPSVARYRTDVPSEVDRVLGRALAKRRADRWHTAQQFRDALVEAWTSYRMRAVLRGAHYVSGRRPPNPDK